MEQVVEKVNTLAYGFWLFCLTQVIYFAYDADQEAVFSR